MQIAETFRNKYALNARDNVLQQLDLEALLGQRHDHLQKQAARIATQLVQAVAEEANDARKGFGAVDGGLTQPRAALVFVLCVSGWVWVRGGWVKVQREASEVEVRVGGEWRSSRLIKAGCGRRTKTKNRNARGSDTIRVGAMKK